MANKRRKMSNNTRPEPISVLAINAKFGDSDAQEKLTIGTELFQGAKYLKVTSIFLTGITNGIVVNGRTYYANRAGAIKVKPNLQIFNPSFTVSEGNLPLGS
jgi:hypothetical protein